MKYCIPFIMFMSLVGFLPVTANAFDYCDPLLAECPDAGGEPCQVLIWDPETSAYVCLEDPYSEEKECNLGPDFTCISDDGGDGTEGSPLLGNDD